MPLLVMLLALFLSNPVFAQQKVVIISSGETHAMLDACDCSDTPAGGFAKRSSLVAGIRAQKKVLLLDAGGFSGGGLYDFYTEGRARDSLRTLAAIEVMAAMHYDAVAIGDEELQFGAGWLRKQAQKNGLPLISANCLDQKGVHIAAPYKFVKKGSVTFGITAVTTQEQLFGIDTSVVVGDPILAIKKIWKKLKQGSDYQVILSHLGEEYTSDLAEQFPDCTILVNGHRKKGLQAIEMVGTQYVMQFGFQGKFLSFLDYNPDTKQFAIPAEPWLTVDDTLPDDGIVSTIIARYESSALPVRTVLDLYLMSQCPYGIPALEEVLAFAEAVPSIELHVWFIGDILEDGAFRSLHGKEEIEDEKLWLAVKAVYPELWYSFLYLCSKEKLPGSKAAAEMNLDTIKLAQWITRKGDALLADHYIRSNRLDVEASPSLFVNNHLYQSEISYARLSKSFCEGIAGGKRPTLCDSLPECFEDSDCLKPGKVGKCVRSEDQRGGSCSFSDAVTFTFTVVTPDSALIPVEQQAIATTKELFPGAIIKRYSVSSVIGKKLVKQLHQKTLPLYLFDTDVKKSTNFSAVEPGLVEAGQWLTFKPGVMKPSYFVNRSQKKQQLTLYIDPLFPNVDVVVKKIFSTRGTLKNIIIKPIIYMEKSTPEASAEEKARLEESLRWLILEKYHSKNLLFDYLKQYNPAKGGVEWQAQCKTLNIDCDKFSRYYQKSNTLLSSLYNELVALDIRGPVELVYENREVVPIKNQKFLDEIVSALKNRL